jgi:hypothetical protein
LPTFQPLLSSAVRFALRIVILFHPSLRGVDRALWCLSGSLLEDLSDNYRVRIRSINEPPCTVLIDYS